MMLHVTPQSNGYFENVWAWVADHDLDDANNKQVAVAVGRGILIESNGPTWLYGTASEHSMLYQYNFANSSNTFAGMIQTESPYFQATDAGKSPGPFASTIGMFKCDPNFSDKTCNSTNLMCEFSWAVMMQSTTNLTIAGAGLYSWFGNYIQSCVDSPNCQQRITYDDGYNGGLRLWNLITIGSVEMVSGPLEIAILAKDNTQAIGHPFWSALAGYLDNARPEILSCDDEYDPRPECASHSICPTERRYRSFASLQADLGSIPFDCINYLALDTLWFVLGDALSNFTAVDNGYDSLFGYYQDYMKAVIPQTIQNVMSDSTPGNDSGGPGNKFSDCELQGSTSYPKQQCPISVKQREDTSVNYIITYTLRDPDGFYNFMKTQYGIDKSWIKLAPSYSDAGGDGDCELDSGGHSAGCIHTNDTYLNFPLAADNIIIPNPKDVITQALPNLGSLQNQILATSVDLTTGFYNGSSSNFLEAYSTPVFMVQQAIQSMQRAKDIGKTEKRDEQIQLALEILGVVFAFLPFLDKIGPELELADGLFTALADVGNVALAIQQIVADPSSAPMAILGALSGPGGRTEEGLAKIAKARRDLTEDDIAGIGDEFKERNNEFQKTIKRDCAE
ncbi:Hypothetical protein R9X50_00418900 [Acrodontium crateriforme]|uniref:Uncharacterized protein n=1 Tax=Acrodontium crateriforme TaxID=150365 RepID=A0AAQ3M3W3_9PEZI|nr:Hypothetical protein R9X50_00418900 [Acrodontium crateriforme]